MFKTEYMEDIIETIKRIEKARTALRQAIADNELATSPKLNDLSLIPKIYGVFEEIKGGKPCNFSPFGQAK